MKENIVKEKSYTFALRIVKLVQIITAEQKEFVLSKQLLKSGTAIGALIREAEHGQSRADFVSKMNIALKEANETDYWLSLLKDSGYITPEWYDSISKDAKELVKLLASIVKTIKTDKTKKS